MATSSTPQTNAARANYYMQRAQSRGDRRVAEINARSSERVARIGAQYDLMAQTVSTLGQVVSQSIDKAFEYKRQELQVQREATRWAQEFGLKKATFELESQLKESQIQSLQHQAATEALDREFLPQLTALSVELRDTSVPYDIRFGKLTALLDSVKGKPGVSRAVLDSITTLSSSLFEETVLVDGSPVSIAHAIKLAEDPTAGMDWFHAARALAKSPAISPAKKMEYANMLEAALNSSSELHDGIDDPRYVIISNFGDSTRGAMRLKDRMDRYLSGLPTSELRATERQRLSTLPASVLIQELDRAEADLSAEFGGGVGSSGMSSESLPIVRSARAPEAALYERGQFATTDDESVLGWAPRLAKVSVGDLVSRAAGSGLDFMANDMMAKRFDAGFLAGIDQRTPVKVAAALQDAARYTRAALGSTNSGSFDTHVRNADAAVTEALKLAGANADVFVHRNIQKVFPESVQTSIAVHAGRVGASSLPSFITSKTAKSLMGSGTSAVSSAEPHWEEVLMDRDASIPLVGGGDLPVKKGERYRLLRQSNGETLRGELMTE